MVQLIVVAHLPPFEECNVDDGGVVVDKLEGEQFEGDAVIILLLGTQAFQVCQPESQPVVDLQSNAHKEQNYLNEQLCYSLNCK